ncbi:MAG: type II toxin-antitoxin system mRNA interferase toxin, RelE/StbE family [Candidatus Pacebacteria bacterium]|nr:type II toxin-antitoxin system mRNA interferase toxin, RelE/StbE family [Candidatus Paceibacterota bacterium]
MEIEYSPKFIKQFKKLPKEIKESALKCEKLFRENPFNPKLKTHKLHGTMQEYWAFSISYNYRIGFTFFDTNSVHFHAIGSHDIYK